jgi:hypothetical protein
VKSAIDSMLRVVLGAAALVGVAMSSAVAKDPAHDTSMRFGLVRSSDPGCEPACPEWIWAYGDIKAESVGRLKKMLAQVRGRRLPIMLSSGGGDVDAAIAMGRLIRKAKLDVGVALTRFGGCLPTRDDCLPSKKWGNAYPGDLMDSAAVCASACQLMFSGGVGRYAGQHALVGVHQVTTTITTQKIVYKTYYRVVKGKKKVTRREVVSRKPAGTRTTTKLSPALRKRLQGYFAEMGIRPVLVDKIETTDADSMYWLSPVDLSVYNIVTSPVGPTTLVTNDVCQKAPAGANCRLLTVEDIPG